MSEAKFKKELHRGFLDLSSYLELPLHWQLHEDSLSVGIPDISYGIMGTNGWIEAKWDSQPPENMKRYDPHFQPYQEAWLVARGRAGGTCHLVNGFPGGFLIMSHEALARRRPDMTWMDIADLSGAEVHFTPFGRSHARTLIHGPHE